MKKMKGVIYHVEHTLKALVSFIVNTTAIMKTNNERRQGYGIIKECAAFMGREELIHEKAASRKFDYIVFYQDFLGPKVFSYTSYLIPGLKNHFTNSVKFEYNLVLHPSRTQRLDYYCKWQRAILISNSEDYCGGYHFLAYR